MGRRASFASLAINLDRTVYFLIKVYEALGALDRVDEAHQVGDAIAKLQNVRLELLKLAGESHRSASPEELARELHEAPLF